MSNTHYQIKTALLSVSDKTGITDFAQALVDRHISIIATGGTAKLLEKANIQFTLIEEISEYPELMRGQVKSLHPKIHAAILGDRINDEQEAEQYDMEWIDMVVCNFYPFSEMVNDRLELSDISQYIDIGGPTMLRGAAKNFTWSLPVCDSNDYDIVLTKIDGIKLDREFRKQQAAKAFQYTAAYEAGIANYFLENTESDVLQCNNQALDLNFHAKLRYGENPHQSASIYRINSQQSPLLDAYQLNGKPMSYNNYIDANAALELVQTFDAPACVIIKHTNPCGVSSQTTVIESIKKAWQSDNKSAFGGVIAINRSLDLDALLFFTQFFIEVIIAPEVTPAAFAELKYLKNCRVLQLNATTIIRSEKEYRHIPGAVLIQDKNTQNMQVDIAKLPSVCELNSKTKRDVIFSWKVVQQAKSNAIVIANNETTLAISAGQVSRVDAVALAIKKAKLSLTDAVLASDGFFPFRDSIDLIAKTGIKTIVTPGGSIRDNEISQACKEHGICLIYTPCRSFLH